MELLDIRSIGLPSTHLTSPLFQINSNLNCIHRNAGGIGEQDGIDPFCEELCVRSAEEKVDVINLLVIFHATLQNHVDGE